MNFFKKSDLKRSESFALVRVSDQLHQILSNLSDEVGTIKLTEQGGAEFIVKASTKNDDPDIYKLELENIDKPSLLVVEDIAKKEFFIPKLVPAKGTCFISNDSKLTENLSAEIKNIQREMMPSQTLNIMGPQIDIFKGDGAKKLQSTRAKERRERMDRNELEKLVFDLFSESPKITFQEISDETMQPKNYLEGVLKNICDFESIRGTKFYYLKPEYRKQGLSSELIDNEKFNLKDQPYKKFKSNY